MRRKYFSEAERKAAHRNRAKEWARRQRARAVPQPYYGALTLNQLVLGDPPPGRSALDQKFS